MRVSVVVPVYNEAATVLTVLERVRAVSVPGAAFELIVVDDGSRDGTADALRSRPELYDALISRPANGGKGAAVRDGLLAATGDYVLFQDADLEYDPSEYGVLLMPAMAFRADIVLGSRFLAPRYTRVHYFMHKAGNRLLTLLFNLLNNTTFTDIYSCYLLYRRGLLDPALLRSDGWEQHAEILADIVRKARMVYEVPISYHGRGYEEGKKIKPRHAVAVMLMIIRKAIAGPTPAPAPGAEPSARHR
ncbi:MAG: glycosyltransferase family 2 protein [Alphaproteobacteria bacterium]|nr:glycosyltransferase family 2 protein [Alphaproteobacteria bacterium]